MCWLVCVPPSSGWACEMVGFAWGEGAATRDEGLYEARTDIIRIRDAPQQLLRAHLALPSSTTWPPKSDPLMAITPQY